MLKCRLIAFMFGFLLLKSPYALASGHSQVEDDLQQEFNLRLRDSRIHDDCEIRHKGLHSQLNEKILRAVESVLGSKIVKFKESTPADDAYARFANGVICSLRFHEGHRADDPQMSFMKLIFSHCLTRENKEFSIQSQIPELEERLVCP